jgi:hypothetical protein
MLKPYDEVVKTPVRRLRVDYDRVVKLKTLGWSGEKIKRHLKSDLYHGHFNWIYRNYKKALEAKSGT